MTKKDIEKQDDDIELEDFQEELQELKDELEEAFGGITDLGNGQFILEFDDDDGTKSEEELMNEFFEKLRSLGGDLKITALKADGTIETLDDIDDLDLSSFIKDIKPLDDDFIDADVAEKLQGVNYHPNASNKFH